MDFTSIKPILAAGKPMESRELERAVRIGIAAEHDAAAFYETIADSTKNEKIKELFQDVANEEKVHIGEFEQVLKILNKKNEEFVTEGKGEAMKKMSALKDIQKEAFEEELQKIAASPKISEAAKKLLDAARKKTGVTSSIKVKL